jgi:Uma2 family endonuclease
MQAEQSIPAIDERISFEDFLVRYDGVAAEWIDGAVELMSPTSSRHNELVQFLVIYLRTFAQLTGSGRVFIEPMVMRLGDKAREPDLMLLLNAEDTRIRNTHIDGPADLVIEIVSPESDVRDRVTKLVEYAAGGVREYWIVDPAFQEALFYIRNDQGQFARAGLTPDGIFVSMAVPRLSLKPSLLWSSPLPDVLDIVAMLQADLGGRG